MKKPNLFNSVAATAACIITGLLNAALPPAAPTQWKWKGMAARLVGEYKGLGPYEIQAIQQQLKLQSIVPLKIINNEVLSFRPHNRNADAIEFTLQQAKTGAIISTTEFHTHSDSVFANPFDIVPEQKIINVPSIPVIANIYHVTYNNDAEQRAQQKKLIGSFSLTQEELSNVEVIVINLNYSEMRHKNGIRISGGHC